MTKSVTIEKLDEGFVVRCRNGFFAGYSVHAAMTFEDAVTRLAKSLGQPVPRFDKPNDKTLTESS